MYMAISQAVKSSVLPPWDTIPYCITPFCGCECQNVLVHNPYSFPSVPSLINSSKHSRTLFLSGNAHCDIFWLNKSSQSYYCSIWGDPLVNCTHLGFKKILLDQGHIQRFYSIRWEPCRHWNEKWWCQILNRDGLASQRSALEWTLSWLQWIPRCQKSRLSRCRTILVAPFPHILGYLPHF